ncbi:MAG: DUF4465 domain-containing protein [Alistipes sp.]|nr:DUF4465 domain-containing protein [Alistipes sp.]
MKKLFIATLSLLAFVACSDNDDNGGTTKKEPVLEYITFEDGTLFGPDGEAVVPGHAVVAGSVSGSYENIFWAKPYAEEVTEYDEWSEEDVTYSKFDDLLFSTADRNAWFGSYYSDGRNWGMVFDTWNGFAVSKNCNNTAGTMNYDDQFSVWAASGARGSESFLAAYCSTFGGTYSVPTIEFAQACKVDHLYVANSTVTYCYASDATEYKLVITGYRAGEETGRVEVALLSAEGNVADWTKVMLFEQEVDKLVFTTESDDAMCPTYFCVDEIAVVK